MVGTSTIAETMTSRLLARAVVVLLLAAAVVGGCGSASERAPRPADRPVSRVLTAAPPSTALSRHADGGLLVAPLGGGQIGFVRRDGRLVYSGFRAPPVRTDGQRGLLSLALSPQDILYASWTPRGSDRLVVGILGRRGSAIIWKGPHTTRFANGGHLEFAPDGRLVIGIGESKLRPGASGAMLSLDPNGPPSQVPRILSTGWNNPYAFAFAPDGSLWVADNATGRQPERLARGDGGKPYDITDLPRKTAPSGLAALPNGDLAMCGVVSGTLDRYRHESDGHWKRVGMIATGCRYGVALLTDGRLAYADDRAIRVVPKSVLVPGSADSNGS
jgi:glucose/arabinose dehydrogenase